MKLSVIIPTYNRREILLRFTLPALLAQDLAADDFEVIIVDDGSSDGTGAAVAEFGAANPQFRLVFVRQANRGPAAARNRGIGICRGDHVLIMGDDTFPERRDFLSCRLDNHGRLGDPRIGILGYTGWYPVIENRFMRWMDRCGIQFGYPWIKDGEYVDFRHGYTSNLSLSRALAVESGERFSESFSGASGEDAEYCFRLCTRHGMRLLYLRELALLHHHVYDPAEYLRRCRQSAIGKAEMKWINPECFRLSCSQSRVKDWIKLAIGGALSLFPVKGVLAVLLRIPPCIGRVMHYSIVDWEGHRLERTGKR